MRGTVQDVFPVQVTIASVISATPIADLSPFKDPDYGHHSAAARVTVANRRVLIAVDDSASPDGPSVILNEPYDDKNFFPSSTRDGVSHVITNFGTKIVYVRDAACGCGSRLRSWNPLRHMQ